MFTSSAAWVLAGVFLAVLIVVRRFQTTLIKHSPEGFRYFSGGLSLLSLTVLARLFHTEGMLSGVPFLSEQIFFDLAYWIGVIAGGSMVVNGASNWLPLARRAVRSDSDRTHSSDLLRRVQQLVGVENRIDAVLANTLTYMNECVGFSSGAVFKLSRTHAQIELAATTPDFPIAREEMDNMVASCFEGRRQEEKAVDLERCLAESLPSSLSRPAAVIPMEVGGRIAGCFVFWCREGSIEPQDRLSLQLAADIVAHKIDRDQLHAARQADRRRADWFVALEDSVALAESTVRKVAAMARGLAEAVPFDSLAVTVVPGRGARTIRYSSASGGNVLVERSVEMPLPGAMTEQAFSERQTVVFGDLSADRQPDYREIITHGRVRSLIAVPIQVRGDFAVVLTLASARPEAYGRTNRRVLQLLRPLVLYAVQSEIINLHVRREVSKFETLGRLSELSTNAADIAALVHNVACVASEETGADVVRVSRVDESGLFLESKALVTSPGRSGSVPADGQMILALMPLHDQALKSGRLCIGRLRSDADLTDMEAHQIFGDDIKQAAIMPLTHDGRIVGVITVAFESDESPILDSAPSRVYLSLLAAVAASLLARGEGWNKAVCSDRGAENRRSHDLSNRLKSFDWDEVPTESPVAARPFETNP
jgi:transcriptional regulator with GAF, ATPase, and Fis domain